MLSMTVRKILEVSLRAIHVISPTESLSSGQAITAMEGLNLMLAYWSTMEVAVPVITRETLNLVANQASYTWGTAGNLTTARPLALTDTCYVNDGSSDVPLDLIGEGQYNAIPDKTVTGIPEKVFFKTTFPLATLYFYPVPDAVYVATLNSQKLLTDYDSLTTTISLSPEYYAAIVPNLAIQLCPDYEREPSQTIVVLAERTLNAIIALNAANRLEPIKLNLGLEGNSAPISLADFKSGVF
ncbi:MAG: hypothetical protein WC593_15050 [Methanoregula sp.]